MKWRWCQSQNDSNNKNNTAPPAYSKFLEVFEAPGSRIDLKRRYLRLWIMTIQISEGSWIIWRLGLNCTSCMEPLHIGSFGVVVFFTGYFSCSNCFTVKLQECFVDSENFTWLSISAGMNFHIEWTYPLRLNPVVSKPHHNFLLTPE